MVDAAGEEESEMRPLTVVPPAFGKRVSHLVVGILSRPDLLVFALPSLCLVHTHILEGMQVVDLAADPWGEALAIRDAGSHAIHVLAWPLSRMPTLE